MEVPGTDLAGLLLDRFDSGSTIDADLTNREEPHS
jgi:hypothetical protein